MTEALQQFFSTVVKPCLQVEPGASMRDEQVQKLLDFLRADPQTSSRDLRIVNAVISGDLSRHPAVQGVMCACLNRVHMLESGNSTFRSKHRAWVDH